MNQSSSLGVATGANLSSGIMNNPWLPGGLAAVGVLLVVLGFSAVSTNRTTSTILEGVGIILMLIAGGIYSKGSLANVGSISPETKGNILPIVGGLVGFIFLIGIFYNFFAEETIPLVAGLGMIAIIVFSVGGLLKFAGANVASNTLVRFGFSLFFFMPYALFTFGFVSDVFRNRVQYIPASISGLLGVLFNYAISARNNPPTVPENALCEIPGLSILSSKLAPQSMMFTLSTLSYIATNISRSYIKEGSVKSVDHVLPAWLLVAGVAGAQILALWSLGCIKDNNQYGYGILLPVGWGILTGMIGSSMFRGSDTSTSQNAEKTSSSQSSSQTCANGVEGEIYLEPVEEKFTNPDITVLRTG